MGPRGAGVKCPTPREWTFLVPLLSPRMQNNTAAVYLPSFKPCAKCFLWSKLTQKCREGSFGKYSQFNHTDKIQSYYRLCGLAGWATIWKSSKCNSKLLSSAMLPPSKILPRKESSRKGRWAKTNPLVPFSFIVNMEIGFGGPEELNPKWTKNIWTAIQSPPKSTTDQVQGRSHGGLDLIKVVNSISLRLQANQTQGRVWPTSPALYLRDRGVGVPAPGNKQILHFHLHSKRLWNMERAGTYNQKSGKSQSVGTDSQTSCWN